MDGEQESIALEAEAPIEPVEPNEPENLEAAEPVEPGEVEDEEAREPNPEEELEEFDWDGKKIKGPKGLKDGVLRQADYTRKTQAVAEKERALEARAAQIEQASKVGEEEMNARAALISIDSDLKSYENVDWDAWETQDLFAAQAGFRKFQQLKAARGEVAGYLGERQKARTEQTQQETAKRLQETRRYAETQIKGWSEEVDKKVTDFATKELGFDWNTLKGAYTPAVYRALHLAWLGHQAINTKPNAPAPKLSVEPLKVVAAKANPPARKNLAEMSMEEYVAHAKREGRI
ncbi:hypothetical protein [Mesorhizobium wenxiniae]|uniref:Scaffolding protein n=1 Tax=Mesorhizobium wenxiniae TaxID=2014805 RepID=A0A271KFR1_9HYPH|nr:hypothetical protein [Mesorhizobium wenxiniae]PAP93997.1 hypothetical protein CIT31_16655 [Mesorhizobium wenxiniae]